ncbi:MAG: hypothetical protein HYZ13_10080 [Acidobacteria bacterium]|nr:hypothetical protein [Acidobacteriota bacterium]
MTVALDSRDFAPFPFHVPRPLIRAFSQLGVEPVLVGGAVVEVWTGEREGVFKTMDLDFVGPEVLTAHRIHLLHLEGVEGGEVIGSRHLLIEGIPVEFPTGPLGIGDAYLNLRDATLQIPTREGDQIRCLRPEACVLDRLATVASEFGHFEQYIQALAVAVAQSNQPGWSDSWIEALSKQARLHRLWAFMRQELESGQPQAERLDEAMSLGWDPLGYRG